MRKLLFVMNTMGRAGAERALVNLLWCLDPADYEIHLLALINRGELFAQVPPYVIIENDSPDSRSALSGGGRATLIKTVLRCALRKGTVFRLIPYLISNGFEMLREGRFQLDKLLWRVLSDGTPPLGQHFDAAIAFLEGGAAYFAADHVEADRKAVFIHIGMTQAGYSSKLDRRCYDPMKRIFTVSNEVRRTFLSLYPQYADKTEVVYNIILKERILAEAYAGRGFADEFSGKRVLSVGRLHYQKGYDIALRALKQLLDWGLPVRWYILGEGPLRNRLESLAKELGVEKQLFLLGSVENPYPYIKECDLYVHTSRYEGKSVAIEEAQALGKAIAATDCTGIREQIEDGVNGMLCQMDAQQIAVQVRQLLEDDELRQRLEENNRRKSFDWEPHLEHFKSFLNGEEEEEL